MAEKEINPRKYDLEDRTFQFAKDFVLHIKISRKEAKESRYWLRLLDTGEKESVNKNRDSLIQEATELMNIFGSIVRKSE